jgi:riboflavin biosynthesis pyrimidine reductase
LADKITLYVAPVVLGACGGVPLLAGELPPELRLRDLSIRQFGHDAVIEAYFDYLSGEQIQPLETR